VIVTYNRRAAMSKTLPALLAQLEPEDELIVVDNASSDGTVELVERLAPNATVVRISSNEGLAAGCNTGAQLATKDVLVILDSDATPSPGFCDEMRRPYTESRDWTSWVGLITSDEGRTINASGGVIHFTGIAWAGSAGEPISAAPTAPVEVPFAPGTCRAVPKKVWDASGGLDPEYFIYHEDVEFSLRLRLAGGTTWLVPGARVDHAYEFVRQSKWRLLERNRWATILRTYPGVLLTLVAPGLLLTELLLIPASIAGGWGAQKLGANFDTIRAMPRLLRERRYVQGLRRIEAVEFARWLVADLSSPNLGIAARSRLVRTALRSYWAVVLSLLRLARRFGVR
jgi:GT2 family glycosyltransferase